MIKFRFLDRDIGNSRYNHKCGVDPVTYLIGSLGSSVVGGMASVFGAESANETNMDINMMSLKQQREENQRNRDWQSKENATNRQFEHNEANLSRAEQNRYWHDQFNTESAEWYNQQDRIMQNWYEQQEYNSPANQVARARAAGFNPSAVTAQGGGLQDSSVMMQSASVPSVAAPSSPIPTGNATSPAMSPVPVTHSVGNVMGGVADMLRSVGSFVGDLSKADVDQTFKDDSLRLIRENWKSLELKNRMDTVSAYVAENTKDVQVNKFMQEYANLVMMYDVLGVEFDERTQNVLNKKEERLLTRAQRVMTNEQYEQLKSLFPYVQKDLIQTIATKKAQESEAYASSFRQRAEGVTENELRELRYKSLDLHNEVLRVTRHGLDMDNWLKDTTLKERASIIIENAKQARLITQQEATELAKDLYNYNTRKINSFFNWLGQGAGAFRDFGIGSSMHSPSSKSTPVDSPWTIYGGTDPNF